MAALTILAGLPMVVMGAYWVFQGWRHGIFRGAGGITYREDRAREPIHFWIALALRVAVVVLGIFAFIAGIDDLLK